MMIDEFVREYCKDIVSESKKKKIVDELDLTYDELIEEDGESIAVIWDNGNAIDIQDIFLLDECDFEKAYPGSLEAYRNYRSNFIILNGMEVFVYYRRMIENSREEIEEYKSLGLGEGEWI
jgi:hypothetical protein